MKIYQGDCIEVLKKLKENSIDTVICDPPYGLEFMGKKWDYDVPGIEVWKECLRVLKPGGTALIFAGSRTQHRMACNVEDAGFQLFDTIYYHYGSGFPKSYNIAKGITKQIDKMKKGVYNEYESKYTICEKLNNVNTVEQTSQKNQTETGTHILKNDFVVVNVSLISKEIINQSLNVIIAELNLGEANHLSEQENIIVQRNVGTKIKQKLSNVKTAEKNLKIQNQTKENTVQKTATIYQCKKIMDKIKVEEVLKIGLGNLLLLKKTITSVNYAELIENLKLIILNQSKTFQNLDTKYQTELLIATNVIITKSTMECLISSTESILDKEKEKWTGWGTALKPSTEPIICARKKVDTNYVLNALKHGVSGLNIDGGRVEHSEKLQPSSSTKMKYGGNSFNESKTMNDPDWVQNNKGRFPANLILECICDEVIEGGEVGNGAYPKLKKDFTGKSNITFRGAEEREKRQNIKEKAQIHTNPNCPCKMLDEQSGSLGTGKFSKGGFRTSKDSIYELGFKKKNIQIAEAPDNYGDKGGASRFFRIIEVDEDYSFMLQLDICGLTLENQRVAIILNGVKKEIEKYILGVEQFLCGKKKTENFQKDIVFIIKMVIKQMTELRTLNVLPENHILNFTQESEKTIRLLKELSVENVRDAENINHLIVFKNEVRQLIKDIVKNVLKKNSESGEVKTGKGTMNTTDNIAKRFLYQAKASKSERNLGCESMEKQAMNGLDKMGGSKCGMKTGSGNERDNTYNNNHPTVKPLKLMEYLCTLTRTPTGGIVLDPFMGSGTTGIACVNTDREFIGIEKEADYVRIAEARIKKARELKNRQKTLF